MNPKYSEDLEKLKCAVPKCKHDHDDQAVQILQDCHPGAPMIPIYVKPLKVIAFACMKCMKQKLHIKVASEADAQFIKRMYSPKKEDVN